jgi:hypothetical protein
MLHPYLLEKRTIFLDLLTEFPEVGTLENNDLNIRGFVIVKQLTIFYQIRDNEIILLNFYDNRQKPKNKKYSTTKAQTKLGIYSNVALMYGL